MGTEGIFAAADLGASSGRVILGRLRDGVLTTEEVSRFDNTPEALADGLHWDGNRLYAAIRDGFREALARAGHLDAVGIDTWGVDYGRLDAGGAWFEAPFNYRDSRTDGVPERVFAVLPAATLYAITGAQVQPFNTIFQLVAGAGDPGWDEVESILLMPDLFAHRLTGRSVAEVTNASTTAMLDVTTRRWSPDVAEVLRTQFGVPLPRVLPELVEPGTVLGATLPGTLDAAVPVVAVGSHDTASAVASVPAENDRFAFISSGTWSLVGLELDAPVLTEASRAANFTNELGIDHTVRYLKNVMGLWVLSECQRAWAAAGLTSDLATLLAGAAERPARACVLDMSDPRLLPPGDMPGRLAAMAAETGQPWSSDPIAVTRCIMDSLAVAYAEAITEACRLSGREVDVVHIVGGGSRNALLCQLTADTTGLPVVAGPAEGTALGNLLVQARAVGAITGDRWALRAIVRASEALVRYEPKASNHSE